MSLIVMAKDWKGGTEEFTGGQSTSRSKLEVVNLQHKLSEFWVQSTTSRMMADTTLSGPVNFAEQVNTLLTGGLSFKTLPNGEMPQWARTLIELTSETGPGRNKGLARHSAKQLQTALDQLITATQQSVEEQSKVYAIYNRQLTPEENKISLAVRVLGRFGTDGVDKVFKDQTLQRNIKKAISFATEGSEMISIQAKVVAVNNPLLVDPRMMTPDGLYQVKPGAPLYATLLKGVGGEIRLGVHSSVFAQFAIDNDGDVVQLGIMKKKGESIFKAARAAFFQKSPNLRFQGSLRIVNGDYTTALTDALRSNPNLTEDDYVDDPMNGRKMKVGHVKAVLSREAWVKQMLTGSNLDIMSFGEKDPSQPFRITPEDTLKMGTRMQTFAEYKSAVKNGSGVTISTKDGMTTFDFESSHKLYKEDDLDSIVNDLLDPRNKSQPKSRAAARDAFLDQYSLLLDAQRVGNLGEVTDLSGNAVDNLDARVLATTWFKYQNEKTLVQVKGNKDIGMLTNTAITYDLHRQALKADAVFRRTGQWPIDAAEEIGLGMNQDALRFLLETQGLKASASGKMASNRDMYGGEDPRRLASALNKVAFDAKNISKQEGYSRSSVLASMVQDQSQGGFKPHASMEFGRAYQDSRQAFFQTFKTMREGGMSMDQVFVALPEPAQLKRLTPDQATKQYKGRREKYGVTIGEKTSNERNVFDRMLDLGILEWKSVATSVDAIGEDNLGHFKGTWALVTTDIAGNYRSAGSSAGMSGFEVEDLSGKIGEAKRMETSIFHTVYGVDMLTPEDLLTPEGRVQALDPRSVVSRNFENEKDVVSFVLGDGKGETKFGFKYADWTGVGYNPGGSVDNNYRGLTLDMFDERSDQYNKHLTRNILEKLLDTKEDELMKMFIGESELGTRDQVMGKAQAKLNTLIDRDKKQAMRVLTLLIGRNQAGIDVTKGVNEKLELLSGGLAHTGQLMIGKGSVASHVTKAGEAAHGGSVTVANLNGPVASDDEFLTMSMILRLNGISVQNAWKDTDREGIGARTFYSPNKNSGRHATGIATKRKGKNAGQVVNSVELQQNIMYISPNMYDYDMQDPFFSDYFSQAEKDPTTGEERQGFDKWVNHFFANGDRPDTNHNLEKGQGAAMMFTFGDLQDELKSKTEGMILYQPYDSDVKPSRAELEDGRAVQNASGGYSRRITGDDLQADAKLVNVTGDIKIVPVGSTRHVTATYMEGGAQKAIKVGAAISFGEVGSKMIDKMGVYYAQGVSMGMEPAQVLDILQKFSTNIQRAISTGDTTQAKLLTEEMNRKFGLVRGTFMFNGKQGEGLVSTVKAKINPLISPAEHTADSEIQKTIKKMVGGQEVEVTEFSIEGGNKATMRLAGGNQASENIYKLFGEGGASIISYLSEDGPDALIQQIIDDSEGKLDAEGAIKKLQKALNSTAQQVINEEVEDATSDLKNQLFRAMRAQAALIDQVTGQTYLEDLDRQDARLRIAEARKQARNFGNLTGNDRDMNIILGELDATTDKLDQGKNAMYNAFKEMGAGSKAAIMAGATIAAASAFLGRSRHERKKDAARKR